MRQLRVRARTARVVYVIAAAVLVACAVLSLVPGRAGAAEPDAPAGGGQVLLPATSGPCGQERVPARRAQCEGERAARAQADRRRVQAQSNLSKQWDDAVRDSRHVHWRDALTNRRIALIVGGAWLLLALRRERGRLRVRRRGAGSVA